MHTRITPPSIKTPPHEVLLAQFNLHAHKGGLIACSFHFISFKHRVTKLVTTEYTPDRLYTYIYILAMEI